MTHISLLSEIRLCQPMHIYLKRRSFRFFCGGHPTTRRTTRTRWL